jgi:hypothetical protein
MLAELAKVIAAGATGDRGQLASARIRLFWTWISRRKRSGSAGNKSRTQEFGL